ncbi:glycosyltransferase family 61 protein [Limibaculum sp. FT325]|uniref:glycosyltransferase family 61 protein n=1 Tax=Thermohalobaculum sediminis TaxID=2939436 RepID=UPI0020BFC181|nr:glycosyltransferase family 61 protein [Limibaculum sediminis]MCL5775569.1 glycosyltransferase family 61 protein [Limibaculum sediminis]
MPRAKSRLRGVLNARFLRWWLLCRLIAVIPPLGRGLGMFPKGIGMLEAADRVLIDEVRSVPAAEIEAEREFLAACLANDATADDLTLPGGVRAGARMEFYERPWVDVATGLVLLPELGRTVLLRGSYANWNATSARIGRPRIRIDGRVTVPIPTDNYFHQIVENGIRLLDMLDRPELGGEPITLVHRRPRSRVERALLEGLAAADARLTLREMPDGSLALPDSAVIYFPGNNHWEWPELPPAAVARLGALFEAQYGPPERASGPRLFLSRGGAKLRRLRNEAAVAEMLARNGFETLVATDANHAAQIAMFRAARVIVSVHGAGLANLLFTAPEARVIEIFPANKLKSPYWWICRQRSLHHVPVIGGAGDRDEAFEVDPALIEAALSG